MIHRDTLATKPYYTTLWMRLKKISVSREDRKDRVTPGHAPDSLAGAPIYCGSKIFDERSRGIDLIGEGQLNRILFAPLQARAGVQERSIIARTTGVCAVSGYL
ncbi:MAG: hypothetical protein Q8L74_05880 [Nitrospirota bacterium]|nr:hypothetical protein [Nitrospirota bacterium]MDP2381621.1 hypothetical protein [Nitrospirota bacterium]MDP3597723.1 hypothetical protein [Nitrospirota bacterium]